MLQRQTTVIAYLSRPLKMRVQVKQHIMWFECTYANADITLSFTFFPPTFDAEMNF